MVARLAQIGPQSCDPKLPTLRPLLASRWRCDVTMSRMDPRQDWMLCTVPSADGPPAEILTTALIRLSEGNASYVVRHFARPALLRDLVFTIPGSLQGPDGIFSQIKKKQLEFEASGVELGWRIMGVRRSDAASKYWGSFALSSMSTYWPWSHEFDPPPLLPPLPFPSSQLRPLLDHPQTVCLPALL